MPTKQTSSAPHVGDWIKAPGLYRQAARRGQIIELLGHDRRERRRVRWDERHESILYPAHGVVSITRRQRDRHASR